MVSPVQRRVRQARLRCTRPEHAAHARVLLEDALRTATLPDQGRWFVFRNVHLGRLSPDSSATAWSRRLEQRLQALAASAPGFSERGAAHADAVWFPDAWQAPIELAVRLLRGPAALEWFWPAAVPGWSAGMPLAEAVRSVYVLLENRGGKAATLALARRLWRADCLLGCAEQLPPAVLGSWRPDSSSLESGSAGGVEPQWPRVWLTAPPSWRATVSEWVDRCRPDAAALRWVVAGVLGECSAAHVDADSAQRDADRIAAGCLSSPRAISGFTSQAKEAPSRERSKLPVPAASAAPPAQASPGVCEAVAVPTRLTGAGGLWFVLNLLRQLGWPNWLTAADRAHAGAATLTLLQAMARRLHLAADDAASLWLAEAVRPDRDGASQVALPFCAPALAALVPRRSGPLLCVRSGALRRGRVLLDASGRLPFAAWSAGQRPVEFGRPPGAVIRRRLARVRPGDPLAHALLLAVQRQSWRRAGLGWRVLTGRPARIRWTDTHLDVFFLHHQADARIRRAGFDLDPGWVPWLGRVVNFHYVEELPA